MAELKDWLNPVGSLLGGFVNAGAQMWQNKQDWKHTQQRDAYLQQYAYDMADYTYNQNLEQWNRENEYNSPYQQMQRLHAAGLNPAMMYGQGTNPGVVSANSPQMEGSAAAGAGAIRQQAPSLPDYSQIVSALSQANSAATIADANARKANAEADIIERSGDAQVLNYNLNNELLGTKIRSEKVAATIAEKTIDTAVEIIGQQAQLNTKQMSIMEKSLKKMNSEIAKNASDIAYNKELTEKAKKEALLLDVEARYKEFTFDYAKKFGIPIELLQAQITSVISSALTTVGNFLEDFKGRPGDWVNDSTTYENLENKSGIFIPSIDTVGIKKNFNLKY